MAEESVKSLVEKLKKEYKVTKTINEELKNQLIEIVIPKIDGFEAAKSKFLEDIKDFTDGENDSSNTGEKTHDEESFQSIGLASIRFFKAASQFISVLGPRASVASVVGVTAYAISKGKDVEMDLRNESNSATLKFKSPYQDKSTS